MNTYEVTYRFDGFYWGEPAAALKRSFTALGSLQDRDGEVEHLGGTLTLDADGALSKAVIRYAAPTEGHVGRLVVEARLPVSGIRRLDRVGDTDSTEPVERPV